MTYVTTECQYSKSGNTHNPHIVGPHDSHIINSLRYLITMVTNIFIADYDNCDQPFTDPVQRHTFGTKLMLLNRFPICPIFF